jgi:hypothetical protein
LGVLIVVAADTGIGMDRAAAVDMIA